MSAVKGIVFIYHSYDNEIDVFDRYEQMDRHRAHRAHYSSKCSVWKTGVFSVFATQIEMKLVTIVFTCIVALGCVEIVSAFWLWDLLGFGKLTIPTVF